MSVCRDGSVSRYVATEQDGTVVTFQPLIRNWLQFPSGSGYANRSC